jgi:hypothetical protein
MDEELLLEALKKQTKEQLIHLLLCSFDVLDDAKRLQVFNEIYYKEQTPVFNPQKIYRHVKTFYNDSKAKKYYDSLSINSKCNSDVPEKTQIWFQMLADLFKKTIELNLHNEHQLAVECFDMLYYLQENMSEEIVFADELGSWMIPIKQSEAIPKYIESISKVCKPEKYKERIKLVMNIDAHDYQKSKIFNKALEVGNREQKKCIEELRP